MSPPSLEIIKKATALGYLKRIVPWAAKPSSLSENYKGVQGRIGIVGGSGDYAGAPYFASISAMRLGADLAYVICSEKAGQVIKGYSPDLIVMPLLDHEDETEFNKQMDCLMTRLHALVIGPGLGLNKLLQSRARTMIAKAKALSLPLVLDADSLQLVNEDPSIIESYKKALLTPNKIELQRLLESVFVGQKYDLRTMKPSEIEPLIAKCSAQLNVTILAKGLVDIIIGGSGQVGMKTDPATGSDRRCGGQGDILSGLAATYMHWIGQHSKPNGNNFSLADESNTALEAGYLAALTVRRANQLAFKQYKGGMLASHMIEKVYPAFEELLSESKQLCEAVDEKATKSFYAGSLTRDDINRYSRQMIMQDFGPERQIRLKQSSALIVGAGGLGCPAAVYLGAGGMGRLGLVDHDVVEASNLHRQILHNIRKLGWPKTESIRESIWEINPNVLVDLHPIKMDRYNAVPLIQQYDMVIDATDNLLARYMISDACVIAKKPLISGAALGWDGQLTVYNYDKDTPCFRCLFPEPPPSAAVGSCSENGVLGVVPGIIGVQQAMEAIRLGSGLAPAYAGKMLLYDGQLGRFRQVTLSGRRTDCQACGPQSSVLDAKTLVDYEHFLKVGCTSATGQQQQQQTTSDILQPSERITAEEYSEVLKSDSAGQQHVLIDVRPLAHSQVSRFAHALQIPTSQLLEESNLRLIREKLEAANATKRLFIVCRRGIASQRGVRLIQEAQAAGKLPEDLVVKDMIGGMTGWSSKIDPTNYSCL